MPVTLLPTRRFWLLLAAIFSACAYPAMYVYFHNLEEAVFAGVFPPTLVFFAIALMAWLVFRGVSGSMAKGAFTALVFLFVFINYTQIDDSIRQIAPDWRWWRIAPTFLFLFINLALALRVWAARPEADAAFFKLAMALGVLYLALTVSSAASGIYALPRSANSPPSLEERDTHEDEILPIGSTAQRPNLYFFIFDEYARQDVLRKYTGHDNTPFLKGLEEKGFNVSYSSESSAPKTRLALANLLHYSTMYPNGQSAPHNIRRPPLFVAFKKAGYTTHAILHLYGNIDAELMDDVLKTSTVLTALSIHETVMEASFMAFLKQGGNKAMRADAMDLFQQAADLLDPQSESPTFVMIHFMTPHEPFIFDEEGGPVAFENMHNWAEPGFYANQLRFISKKIDELADHVRQSDPQAVMLLQSDHGPRSFGGVSHREKYACLNALYMGGQPVDIEGLSTINTLRIAMNHALHLNLKMEKE